MIESLEMLKKSLDNYLNMDADDIADFEALPPYMQNDIKRLAFYAQKYHEIHISHVGEGVTTPPLNGGDGSYSERFREAKEWLENEHGDGNDCWVNPIEIRERITEKEKECISVKRKLLDVMRQRNKLFHAIEAIRDPKGHIYHGGVECTPECQDINDVIRVINEEERHKHCGYEECCGEQSSKDSDNE